jgi:multiple sugar transport system permease protein
MKRTLVTIGKLAVIMLLIAWTVVPLLWVFLNSFKTGEAITAYPPQFVFEPNLGNYEKVLGSQSFQNHFVNSIIVSVANVVVVMVLGTLAAYGFSRFHIRGKKHVMFWILSTRMFPPVVASVPFFIIMKAVGMLDTHWALIIAYITINLPFVVWMMKGFFDEVPITLEESAQIYGAKPFQTFYLIALPIAAPGLAATAIFSFIMAWNEFLFALILTGRNAKTMPVDITEYLRWGEGIFWGQISSTAVIILVPVLVLAVLVRNHLVRGMTFGALKG